MKEEIKAAVMIVSSLLILTLLIVLIGGGKFFEKLDIYTVKVMNAAGVETGAQVKLGGVRIGRVVSVKEPVQFGQPVVIEIGIRKGTTLYKGTRALITQVGFVGDIYMLLAIDKTVNERIPPGSEIPAEESVAMGVIIAKLEGIAGSIDLLIRDIDKLFTDKNVKGVEDLITNLNKTVVSTSANVESVSANFRQTLDKFEKVVAEVDRVLNEAEAAIGQVNGLLKDNRQGITEVIAKAREDLEKAGAMIKTFEATAKTLDGAVSVQSQNLDILLESMTKTTRDLQDLLFELKSKPWSVIYKESGKEREED